MNIILSASGKLGDSNKPLTKEQKEFTTFVKGQGFAAVKATSAKQAIWYLKKYLAI